jgi:hypothetical protein
MRVENYSNIHTITIIKQETIRHVCYRKRNISLDFISVFYFVANAA